jgi:hypothetical protein
LIFETAIFVFNFAIKFPTLNCCYERNRGGAEARKDRAVMGGAGLKMKEELLRMDRRLQYFNGDLGKIAILKKLGKKFRSKIVNLRERKG